MLMVCCSTIFIWTEERFKYMHSFLMLHGLKLECWTVADGRPGLSSYLTMEFLYVNWIRESNLFFLHFTNGCIYRFWALHYRGYKKANWEFYNDYWELLHIQCGLYVYIYTFFVCSKHCTVAENNYNFHQFFFSFSADV